MAKCSYCGSTIIFGGKKNGELHFCNDKCYQEGLVLPLANHFPEDIIQLHMNEVHLGKCPKCKKERGSVDVHISYEVWSIVALTSWKSVPQICCRSCGVKSQIGGTVFSFLFGWWGLPWGIIMTPIQIGRNLIAILSPPDPSKPSPQLENMVRINLARQIAANQKE